MPWLPFKIFDPRLPKNHENCEKSPFLTAIFSKGQRPLFSSTSLRHAIRCIFYNYERKSLCNGVFDPKKDFRKKNSDFFLLKAIFCSGLRKSSNQTGNQSCLILIELDELNSELFTKSKNSKYFSRYHEKRKHAFDVFISVMGLKSHFWGIYC